MFELCHIIFSCSGDAAESMHGLLVSLQNSKGKTITTAYQLNRLDRSYMETALLSIAAHWRKAMHSPCIQDMKIFRVDCPEPQFRKFAMRLCADGTVPARASLTHLTERGIKKLRALPGFVLIDKIAPRPVGTNADQRGDAPAETEEELDFGPGV